MRSLVVFCSLISLPAFAQNAPTSTLPQLPGTSGYYAPIVDEVPPASPAPIAAFAPVNAEAPAPTQPVTLDTAKEPAVIAAASGKDPFKDALEHAYNYNPALKAERENLAAIDEGVAQAISGFRPTALAGYDKGRQRRDSTGTTWNYQDTTVKSLDIDQPIFNGGETWANYKSAKERVKAGRAQLQNVEQQVLYDTVVAYTDVVEKQLVLKLSQNNVDVLKKQLDATNARFDAGELTRTDVSQSEARLAKAQADERQALGDLTTARVTFKRIIGYEPPDVLALPAIPGILPATLNEAVDWAQAANPGLIAARHIESAASYDINARAGAILPDVSLHGSMDRTDGSSINGNRLDTDALTVNITIPLYQSGAEWSRLREARSLADRAKFTTLDTHDAVIENVTRSWQDYYTAKAVIISTDQAMHAAEVALEGVRQENEFGVRTILDVLDAEQEAFSSRVNLVKAERAEKVQAYLLLSAVGKLTAKDLGLDVSVYDPKEHYDSVKYQLLGL